MVVVALMNEVGDNQQGIPGACGKARLGQTVLMVELIMVVKGLVADPASYVRVSRPLPFVSSSRYLAVC